MWRGWLRISISGGRSRRNRDIVKQRVENVHPTEQLLRRAGPVRGGCDVICALLSGSCDPDRRPGLCRCADPCAYPMDRRDGDCAGWRWSGGRGEQHPAARFQVNRRGIADSFNPQHSRGIYTGIVDTSTIVILDFGSQYTQLIARRIREFNVFSVVLPCTKPLEEILALKPKGIILSGGPSSVYDDSAPKADPAILKTGLPILGICHGLQFITHHLGGKVVPGAAREYGHAEVTVTDVENIFHELPDSLSVWMSHGDHAESLAPGFHVTATTANAIAGIANDA